VAHRREVIIRQSEVAMKGDRSGERLSADLEAAVAGQKADR
jgi:hypothetical protein